MPNWCDNTTEIVGDRNELLDFLHWVTVKPCNDDDQYSTYDFTLLHEMPADEPNWYEWCNRNWGTKWPPTEILRNDDQSKEQYAEFHYQTAWCPPNELWEKISSLYPNLAFMNRYEEQGNGFFGATLFCNGQTVQEQFVNMLDDDDCMKHFARVENPDADDLDWDDAWTEFNEYMYVRMLKMGEEVSSAIPARIKLLAMKGS